MILFTVNYYTGLHLIQKIKNNHIDTSDITANNLNIPTYNCI